MIPNVTECGLLQKCVDFNVSRSSAICHHQVQPEAGTVEDKGSPPLLQLRQTPVHAPLKCLCCFKNEIKL